LFSLYWAEEAIRYLYIWVAFLGISMGVKSDAHFRLQIFVNILPEPLRTIIKATSIFIVIGFLAVLCYYSIRLLQKQIMFGQITPMLLIPMFIPYAAIAVGTFSMWVRVIIKTYHDIKHPGGVVAAEEGDQ